MTEQEYQEYLTKVSALPEARKNHPQKGFAGARGSRSVFPISPDTQTMVMFVEPKTPDPTSSSPRPALLIVGQNNGITEAAQSYVLVKTVNGSVLEFSHGPGFVVDEVQPPPPAPPQLPAADLNALRALLAQYGYQLTPSGGK